MNSKMVFAVVNHSAIKVVAFHIVMILPELPMDGVLAN
jgi:hypothetical protein